MTGKETMKPDMKLDIVLKADSMGTQEAVVSAIGALQTPGVKIDVIHAEVGHVSKSDLFLAETGSRLVMGLNVDILPKTKEMAKEHQIEVRLHNVIYKFLDDLKQIAESLTLPEEEERVLGKARVIALFSGGKKGIILGCEVLEGRLALGQKFRVISAPGTVYTGTIESLHIEKDAVKEAKLGQQVGVKVEGFKRARAGDIVESYEVERPKKNRRWQPRGDVFRMGA